jgi:hypothetical protein
MKKIFFAGTMQSTPFQHGHRRKNLSLPDDIVVVDSADDADVIVGRQFWEFAEYFHLGRQYYMWTHEPAWCSVADKQFTDLATGHIVHVSTPWNGDVYLNPLYFFPFYQLDAESLRDLARQKKKSCVVLATYRRKFDRYQGSSNVDLSEYRQRIAIELQQKYGYCDIYGRSWPESVKLEGESRASNVFQLVKPTILDEYAFTLTFENTLLRNYVTEKLWDAYRSACVPLYFGRGSGVEAVLNEDSYIDCSRVSSVSELHDLLASMSVDRRIEILNSAFNDIQKITASTTKGKIVQATLDRFAERIREI